MLSLVISFFISCSEKKEAVPFYGTADYTALWNVSAYEKQSLHKIPLFDFMDQNDEHVTSSQLNRKIYLANFFFTSCKSICPKMTRNIKTVYEHFKGNDHVAFLSFSVMPETDSTLRLKQFAEQNGITGDQWHLLTGNASAIYTLARKGYFIEEANGLSKDSTEFLHTENIVLIDGDAHIRGLYNGTLSLDVQRMIKDIEILLEE